MSGPALLGPLRDADRPALAVTLVALAAMTAYAYFGMAPFFDRLAGPEAVLREGHDLHRRLYQVASAFFLLGAVPAFAARVFGARPADLGLSLGDWRFGLKLLALAIPVLAGVLYLGAADRELQIEYPLTAWAGRSTEHFAAWSGIYFFYYVGWEVGFRGVLQIWLGRRIGDLGAMLVQTAASTLLHIGKPAAETFAALVAGPLFGLAALRTRSVLWVLALHYAIGVLTDLFCLLRRAP